MATLHTFWSIKETLVHTTAVMHIRPYVGLPSLTYLARPLLSITVEPTKDICIIVLILVFQISNLITYQGAQGDDTKIYLLISENDLAEKRWVAISTVRSIMASLEADYVPVIEANYCPHS